jgi:TRAP-type C4-dicarboxylate transport system permease small subunit
MIIRRLEQAVLGVIGALFLFFVSVTFLQVILRYGFSHSLAWVDELSRYAFIWLVFLAAAAAARHGTHIAITIIEDLVAPSMRRGLMILADLMLIAFAVLVGYGGYQLMQLNWTTTSPASGLPIAWVQLILPLFGILTALFATAHLWQIARTSSTGPDKV